MNKAPNVNNNFLSDIAHNWGISPLKLYASHYHRYPSRTRFSWVLNFPKFLEMANQTWEVEEYIESIVPITKNKEKVYSEAYLSIGDGVAMHFELSSTRSVLFNKVDEETVEESRRGTDGYEYTVTVLYDPGVLTLEDLSDQYINVIRDQGKECVDDKKLSIVSKSSNGFYLSSHEIKEPEIDFDLNYNEDFEGVDDHIKTKVKEERDGIILLHGPPGTGKTMYIRHLINNVEKDNIIYLPPDLVGAVSQPDFATFLLDYPNSLLIIEDAESAIESTAGKRNQAVSNLLNMADGLLSDALQMQILATFNSDIAKIDEALLRKGRLIQKYKFGPLQEDRAKKLAEELGHNIKIDGPTKLSTIYNPDGEDEEQKQSTELTTPTVGF